MTFMYIHITIYKEYSQAVVMQVLLIDEVRLKLRHKVHVHAHNNVKRALTCCSHAGIIDG